MNTGILSLGIYIPGRRVTNDELSSTLDTSDEWIYSHTGIKSRYVASEKESCSFMASEAAREAIDRASINKGDIDHVIVATITPDYRDFPATANLVQHSLGLGHVGSFDIKAACTGFVYGLSVGRGLLESGAAKNVLLIGVEKLSSIVNWKDRSTAVLFGDGAGAVILGSKEEGGVIDSVLRSDGSGGPSLCIPMGGSSNPFSPDSPLEDMYLRMDGQRVYNFAVQVNVKIPRELMKRNELVTEDIDYIVPHQANYRIILAASRRSGIPLEKYYLNIDEFANTSSASIPLALGDMQNKGLLKKGMKILTVGFGGGLTYGGNYIIW